MTIVTPDYYKNFKCIADRCRHSCCIGWEIDIDDATFNKYDNLKGDFALKLKSNIEFEGTPHFRLDTTERCPFLNSNGLCDIITNLGEDMLCQICSDHPRFRNLYSDFTEVGLGLCCEAAAEIILTKKEKTSLSLTTEASQLPILNFREKLFGILQDRSLPIKNRVNNMLSLIDAYLPVDTNWYSVFYSLERMDKTWDDYLLRIKDGIETEADEHSLDTAYEQLLVYLIFRHFSDCQYDGKVKERVLLAALIYKVIKAMNTSNTLKELIEISRLYSCEIEYSDENINRLLSELSLYINPR
ncbi:MAG: flagellin lysine-N-methylase [Clostridia bacterium]|nr:flagellin lysine-N-methylase [Clostridia bacterium]